MLAPWSWTSSLQTMRNKCLLLKLTFVTATWAKWSSYQGDTLHWEGWLSKLYLAPWAETEKPHSSCGLLTDSSRGSHTGLTGGREWTWRWRWAHPAVHPSSWSVDIGHCPLLLHGTTETWLAHLRRALQDFTQGGLRGNNWKIDQSRLGI